MRKRKQSPAQLANLTHNGAPRQRHGEKKDKKLACKLTPTDWENAKAVIAQSGWTSLAQLWEAIVDGKVDLPKNE